MEADAEIKAMQISGLSASRVCPQCNLSVSVSVTRCPNDGASLLDASEVGTELARQYEFLSVIASGGMGTIYEARHVVLNQRVSIKMMQKERLDEKNVKRFKQEAEALAALEHPNIIHVRDYGLTENGQPYMVLDYVEGMSMSQMIQSRGPIPTAFAIEFFIQIADALDHAHERGVLHQDLKPNNIMICEPGKTAPYAKLIDFGIAKIINGEATPAGLTNTGDILGSPAYMSPEQANGRAVDSRTDIYSLGCVMFEALTGTTPFKGTTALEVIAHKMNTKAPTIVEQSVSEFPRGLDQIVAKCLEKEPIKRFQSMGQLREELLDVLMNSGATPPENTVDPQTAINANHAKKKIVLIVCIAICLVTLATNGVILYRKNAAETARQTEHAESEGRIANEASHVFGSLARPLIQEGLKNWKPGQSFKLDYQNFDSDLEEFSHYPARANEINLENSSAVGPGLAYLIRYPLTFLTLNDSSITDRAFLEIKHMRSLRELQVDNVNLSWVGLKELAGVNLARLSVRFNKLNDRALASIAEIKSLHHLQCGRNDKLTSNGYLELKKLPNLDHLDVVENPIDLKSAKAISQLDIDDLNLEKTSIDDEGLKELCAMPHLHNIGMTGCQHVTGAGLKYLAKLPQLDTVNLEAANIGDKDVEFIKHCPVLRVIDLRSTRVTDKTMELIGRSIIKNIFLLRCSSITDRGLMSLLKNKHLKHIEIGMNQFSQEAQDNFAKQRPGVLRINTSNGKKAPIEF